MNISALDPGCLTDCITLCSQCQFFMTPLRDESENIFESILCSGPIFSLSKHKTAVNFSSGNLFSVTH